MGYYLGNRGVPSGALEAMFTAREYCLTVQTVEGHFLERQLNDPAGGAWRGQYQPAFNHFKCGDFSPAARVLRDLLRQEPDNWRGHQLIGLTRFFQGHLAAAQRQLELAYRLHTRGHAAKGTSLKHAVELHLQRAFLRYALLCVYRRLGRTQEARALLEEEAQHPF